MTVTYIHGVNAKNKFGCYATAMQPYYGQSDQWACNECLWLVPGTWID